MFRQGCVFFHLSLILLSGLNYGKVLPNMPTHPNMKLFYGPILHHIVVVISFISNTAATFASFDCANQKDVLLCRKSFRQKSNCFAV